MTFETTMKLPRSLTILCTLRGRRYSGDNAVWNLHCVEEMTPEDFKPYSRQMCSALLLLPSGDSFDEATGGGYILNISSLAGANSSRMAAYNASKFGLNGFSEALMQEVRHDGIKVSYIMPGSVNTELWR